VAAPSPKSAANRPPQNGLAGSCDNTP
jgi:hypothetical protein